MVLCSSGIAKNFAAHFFNRSWFYWQNSKIAFCATLWGT